MLRCRLMSPPRRRAALIFNPAAGRGSDDLAIIRAALDPALDLTVYPTDQSCDADICAGRARDASVDLVIAAGGDGTVSLVAGALASTRIPLGILARGTSNSIARALEIPTDLDAALDNVLHGQICDVDTAVANGRTMVLHASIGFHAATIGQTGRDAKNRWGVLAYVSEALANLRNVEPFALEMETENEVVRCRATNVMVANFAPLKTLLAQGPSALSPNDGMLDVTIVAATGLAQAVTTGLHLLRTAAQGEPATRDNVGFLSAQRVRITTDPPQPLLIDGEPLPNGPLVAECRARTLRVVVPQRPSVDKPDEKKLQGLPELEIEPKP